MAGVYRILNRQTDTNRWPGQARQGHRILYEQQLNGENIAVREHNVIALKSSPTGPSVRSTNFSQFQITAIALSVHPRIGKWRSRHATMQAVRIGARAPGPVYTA